MACLFNSVLKGANDCKENPAGLSNYCMIVPFDKFESVSIEKVGTGQNQKEVNRYAINLGSGDSAPTSLKGYKVEFKNQTGQVTSEDNGAGKGWTGTGTGRVEIGEDEMAVLSRTLSNLDGNFLAFFPTGNKVTTQVSGTDTVVPEWKVVGNPEGDCQFSTAADSGQARGDDHGTTFTVTCDYMLYDVIKFYGEIEQADKTNG